MRSHEHSHLKAVHLKEDVVTTSQPESSKEQQNNLNIAGCRRNGGQISCLSHLAATAHVYTASRRACKEPIYLERLKDQQAMFSRLRATHWVIVKKFCLKFADLVSLFRGQAMHQDPAGDLGCQAPHSLISPARH